MSNNQTIQCREARKRFAAFESDSPGALTGEGRAIMSRHLEDCRKCAREFRLYSLARATLDAAANTEKIVVDEPYLRALRARINRGPVQPRHRPSEESWAGALLVTARQLIPAMAMLLLLIIGATLFWSAERPQRQDQQLALRPRERVMFSDMYEYPAPTRDDVLETLVAPEEKENGK
jgi:hypothetical protein